MHHALLPANLPPFTQEHEQVLRESIEQATKTLAQAALQASSQSAAQTSTATAEAMARKLAKGQFDLEMMSDQLAQMERMGGLQGVMGMLPGVQALLKRGAKVDVVDKAGWTPLHFATFFSTDTAVMKTLLDAGASINAQNDRGITALYFAAATGHEQQVKLREVASRTEESRRVLRREESVLRTALPWPNTSAPCRRAPCGCR